MSSVGCAIITLLRGSERDRRIWKIGEEHDGSGTYLVQPAIIPATLCPSIDNLYPSVLVAFDAAGIRSPKPCRFSNAR
jgi:hypothetical protein